MRKRFFIFFIFQINFALSAAILDIGKPVTNIIEDPTGSILAVTDENAVYLFDTDSFEKICTLNDKKVTRISFYSENGSYFLATLSEAGKCTVRELAYNNETWSCNNEKPYFTTDCSDPENKKKLVSVAFNNSDYVAAAYNDNSIIFNFRLRATKSSISRTISAHTTPIYGLEFSPSGEFLSTVSDDGEAYIWNVYNNTILAHFNGIFTKQKVPVFFTDDSQHIIFLESKNSIRVSDLRGNGLYSISTNRTITKIKPLKNQNYIAVADDKNQVLVYDISSKEPVYQFKSENRITAFNFNKKITRMYVGFKDGTVEMIRPEAYINENIDINEELEKSFIADDSKKVQEKETNTPNTDSDITPDTTPDKIPDTTQDKTSDKNSNKASKKGSKKTSDKASTEQNGIFLPKEFSSFSIFAGANYLSAPYLFSGNFRSEYLYSKKIAPFFIGGGITLSAGFPRKDFPAVYTIKGKQVDAPKALSAVVYIPFGYTFSPWNNKNYVFTNFRAGAKLTSLGIITKEGSIIGDPSISFFASAGVGIVFNFFELEINCDYDTLNKISPSVYTGFVFKRSTKK